MVGVRTEASIRMILANFIVVAESDTRSPPVSEGLLQSSQSPFKDTLFRKNSCMERPKQFRTPPFCVMLLHGFLES